MSRAPKAKGGIPLYNTTLRNLEYRLRKYQDSLNAYLKESIIVNKDKIIGTLQNQLYQRGINGAGEKIMDYAPYRAKTIARKKRKGQPTTRVTLKDTGAFYRGMNIFFDPAGFYINSSVSYTKDLKKKYKPLIFRLTNQNFTKIVRIYLRRFLVKKLKEELKKK